VYLIYDNVKLNNYHNSADRILGLSNSCLTAKFLSFPNQFENGVHFTFISTQKYLETLPNGPAFWIIDLRSTTFLDYRFDFVEHINPALVDIIRTGRVQILFGNSSEQFDIFQLWNFGGNHHFKDHINFYEYTSAGIISFTLKKHKIPTKFVHYTDGNLDKEPLQVKLRTEFGIQQDYNFYFFDTWIYMSVNQTRIYNPDYEFDTNFLYSCLAAGIPKYHRSLLVYRLWQENLLDRGKVSLHKPWIDYPVEHHSHVVHKPSLNYDPEFIKIMPLVLDGKENMHYKNWQRSALSPNKEQLETEKNLVYGCLLYISTETLLDENNPDNVYITEKTWKAIVHKKPFIILGDVFSLKKLHQLGFKTFNQWWDEGYDEYPTIEQRVDHIVRIIQKFAKMSESELKSHFTGIQTVVEHNYTVLKNMDFADVFLEKLSENYYKML